MRERRRRGSIIFGKGNAARERKKGRRKWREAEYILSGKKRNGKTEEDGEREREKEEAREYFLGKRISRRSGRRRGWWEE